MVGLLYLRDHGSGMLPVERSLSARFLLSPGFVDQGAAEVHCLPPLTPACGAGNRCARRETELPFSLDVLPTSSSRVSSNHLCEEGLRGPGRGGGGEGGKGAPLRDGGRRYKFERCFYKASPSPLGPISSLGQEHQ